MFTHLKYAHNTFMRKKKKVRVSPQHALTAQSGWRRVSLLILNPLNAELNPIRHLLALVGARHIVHVSRIRVNLDGRSRRVASLYPRKQPLLTVQKAMYATGPLWTGVENRKSVGPIGVLTLNRPDGSQSHKVTCLSEYHEHFWRRGFTAQRIPKHGQLHAPVALSQDNILQYPLNRRLSRPQRRCARLEVR